MRARIQLARLVVAVALVISGRVHAQTEPVVALDGTDGAAVLGALAKECYEARLTPEMPTATIMDCSSFSEEPADEGGVVVTHRLRFTLLERGDESRVSAAAWTETEELGSIIEQPVTSEEYLQRVQRVLTAVVARLRSQTAPPWVGRYESEQAWHLDAHLNAVRHCDANLASMTAESVAAELESIGLRALDDDTRDRCEQLYTHLFEWGLARGDTGPTVVEYARYRAALPAEQRLCGGSLAPDAACRP